MDTVKVNNVVDYLSQILRVSKNSDEEIFYRGYSKTSYLLEPSIYRSKSIENENKLIKEVIYRSPNSFKDDKTQLEKLVRLQHFGLPTRLLDITENALVALYFACKSNECDGKIEVFKIPKDYIKYYDSDTVSILANLSNMEGNFSIRDIYDQTIEDFNNTVIIKNLIHQIKEEKNYFRPIIKAEDLEKVIVVKAKNSNERIIRQSGAFFIFGISRDKTKHAKFNEDWIVKFNNQSYITIPENSKKSLLEELKILGINKSVLFPEIEKLTDYIQEIINI